MPSLLGTHIRQGRRKLGLTQTIFGGERYSKSYVSAVERGSIIPSREALRFFAERLDESYEELDDLLKQQISPLTTYQSQEVTQQGAGNQQEVSMLLDLLLSGTHLSADLAGHSKTAVLPIEMVEQLSEPKQARYSYLKGIVAQQHGDLVDALEQLEYALALAPPQHRPTILDALGINYYLTGMYSVALSYHLRALSLLQSKVGEEVRNDLLALIALHCGEDYRALGASDLADAHYQLAHQHLQNEHSIKLAGTLYQGLAYCTFASLIRTGTSPSAPLTFEEQERTVQQAIGFVLQSRTLFQASHNHEEEYSARLLQAMILLDFCSQHLQEAAASKQAPSVICSTLLEEAEEQCRQVLLKGRILSHVEDVSIEGNIKLYTALAYLVRISIQRARLARFGNYPDTALRGRILASTLCQHVLDTFNGRTAQWTALRELVFQKRVQYTTEEPPLPHLLNLPDLPEHSPTCLAEVYFAAGEVAEERGRTTTDSDYAITCYTRADSFFLAALPLVRQERPAYRRDPATILRYYQHYASLLEERKQVQPETAGEISQAVQKLLEEMFALCDYLAFPQR